MTVSVFNNEEQEVIKIYFTHAYTPMLPTVKEPFRHYKELLNSVDFRAALLLLVLISRDNVNSRSRYTTQVEPFQSITIYYNFPLLVFLYRNSMTYKTHTHTHTDM